MKDFHGHQIVKCFLSSPVRGISHFFTDTQNTTYTTKRVEEIKTSKLGLGLASSARREKFVILSLHSVHLWASASMYLTHPLPLANPASGSTHPSGRLPLTSVDCFLLSTALFCPLLCYVSFSVLSGTFLPLSSSGSWEILRAIPLCGFRAKTNKGILWLALTHTHTTNAQHRVTFMK